MSAEIKKHYTQLRQWNDNRAASERKGLEEFWKLKAMFDSEKKANRKPQSVKQ